MTSTDVTGVDTPLLVVPVIGEPGGSGRALVPDGLQGLPGRIPAADLRPAPGSWTVLYPGSAGVAGGAGSATRVLLLGAGSEAKLTTEVLRRYAGNAVRAAETLGVERLCVYVPPAGDVGAARSAEAVAVGAGLAAWRFTELRTPAATRPGEVPPVEVGAVDVLVDPAHAAAGREGVRIGAAVARGQNLARTLQCRPGNVATPTHLADEASRVAEVHGMSVTVLGPAQLRKEGMRALLAVSRGSEEEPRLIVLEHRGGAEGEPPLVLVGKGLTFDAGGISLKPAKGMEDMKYDMSAGAAVLGAMQAVAELRLPVNVVGVVPSSENLVSGRALKPGDVIRTRSEKTVEVVNTDAEGRLILSDALDWALALQPAAIVDCATLTGAVVVGLGHHAAAVLGTDEALVDELRKAGEESGERCWPLPLWDEYRKQLESDAADLKNVGGRPAGTITAGWFLREFVGEVPWAHLDIAGTAYGTEPLPYQRKGGYGIPTRLLVEWVRGRTA